MDGILYIVSTPIGNMKDITLRAIETLESVDSILAEDTRVTGKLLRHYEIVKKMTSLNDFNEESRIPKIISGLKDGRSIALVSDAGTPLISDPGFKLVREALKHEIRVESIPGPSAVISALTISGLPPDKFLFLGYLPKKDGKRRKIISDLKSFAQIIRPTIILYESPYRLTKTLTDIMDIFGDIEIVTGRELTKSFEEVNRMRISEILTHYSQGVKGELVVLF
ncbi:16S rRNA (cytidine(1402)-2'-O)-methyltransferase [Candidatus Curtissbacteria bacterium]|nr:16S rRNA (cytidine(1402)-2'-O)-methyltransferase [Candidatus Curtissbacteria bacterium]